MRATIFFLALNNTLGEQKDLAPFTAAPPNSY